MDGFKKLRAGQTVEFDAADSPRGRVAVSVRIMTSVRCAPAGS